MQHCRILDASPGSFSVRAINLGALAHKCGLIVLAMKLDTLAEKEEQLGAMMSTSGLMASYYEFEGAAHSVCFLVHSCS